jgi:transcriptional regulator with XRE-family HTH domain
MRELGWRLAHHRAAKGLTRHSLGKRAGLNPRAVAAVERGRADVRYATVLRLCDALGMPLSDLFGSQVAPAPRIHEMSMPARAWALVDDGVQPFLLLRDEANYRPGDRIALEETLHGVATGQTLVVEITYLAYGEEYHLAPGCVVAAIQPARDAWTVAPAARRCG